METMTPEPLDTAGDIIPEDIDGSGSTPSEDETIDPTENEANPSVCPTCGDENCDGRCEEPNESMDGDAASALASAGFGTYEDYEHDTPLGEELAGE